MPGLVVDVTELAGNPGASLVISRSEAIPGIRLPLGWVSEDEEVEIHLEASSIIEGIAVSGELDGVLHLSCSRCLRQFDRAFSHDVDETFFVDTRGEEAYEVTGGTIDLQPLIRDVIVLSMPASPLHSPGCKGLCPVCGQDLNEENCGHSREPIDLRWEPLKELVLEPQEE